MWGELKTMVDWLILDSLPLEGHSKSNQSMLIHNCVLLNLTTLNRLIAIARR